MFSVKNEPVLPLHIAAPLPLHGICKEKLLNKTKLKGIVSRSLKQSQAIFLEDFKGIRSYRKSLVAASTNVLLAATSNQKCTRPFLSRATCEDDTFHQGIISRTEACKMMQKLYRKWKLKEKLKVLRSQSFAYSDAELDTSWNFDIDDMFRSLRNIISEEPCDKGNSAVIPLQAVLKKEAESKEYVENRTIYVGQDSVRMNDVQRTAFPPIEVHFLDEVQNNIVLIDYDGNKVSSPKVISEPDPVETRKPLVSINDVMLDWNVTNITLAKVRFQNAQINLIISVTF